MMRPSTAELSASVKEAIAQVDAELRELSLAIHAKPELAWEEHNTHDLLTDFMERQSGFTIVRHAYDLETAWTATWGTEGSCIGFNSEMDALRGIGHACGHNLIAIAGCAAAIGVARTLEKYSLPGRVVLVGTPAEEAGGGKVLLLKRGAYKEMDACLMVHPGAKGNGAAPMLTTCRTGITVQYTGKSAHAGGAPEKGVNALDAAVLGYSAVSALRQQLASSTRVHGIITGGEHWSPNAIPASSKLVFGVRAGSAPELAALIPRVLACFQAAALSTGCSYTVQGENLYLELRHSRGLASAFRDYALGEWANEGYTVPEGTMVPASTDFGNVSHYLPALHPMFNLPDAGEEDFPHSSTFAGVAKTSSAHKACLRVAEAISAVGLRVVTEEAFRQQIRQDWEKDMAADPVDDAVEQIARLLPVTDKPVKGTVCACLH